MQQSIPRLLLLHLYIKREAFVCVAAAHVQAELTDPDKMQQREKKFGKPLLGKDSKDPKDPELMKKRAEKFGKVIAAPSAKDDEARKKVCVLACNSTTQLCFQVEMCCFSGTCCWLVTM